MTAKVIQVIQTDICRGNGTADKPFRKVIQYYSLDGKLLAEDDPCIVEAPDEGK